MSVAQLLGTELGRYRLERILGEGGMGCVYLGVDAERNKRVAIKVLSKQTPEAIQRFLAEARAVSLISHFNIVNLVDLSELPDGRPYMVMELVEGQSLRDAAPTASLSQIANVCCEVLAALEAAHAIGIVHRDLKPDNIMVTRAGHAKVLDFGVAKLAPGVGGGLTPRTKEGLTMGTPAYMAPEQVTGSPVDARTDVYTMGVVLFEALTGQRPFTGGSELEIMRAHRDRPPPKPRALVSTIPPSVEDVILRALAKDPAKRYQTASEMATALADAVQGRPSAKRLPTNELAEPTYVTPPSRLPAMIAVAAIAIAATVVFVIARARRNAHHAVAEDAAIVEPIADALVIDEAIADADVPDAIADAAADGAVADVHPPVAKPSLPEPIHRAASYAADAFDPLKYLATATDLAKELAGDAQLVEIQVSPLAESNLIDLSRTQHRAEYRYISASAAKLPGDDRPCMVKVAVEPSGVTARVETDRRCVAKPFHAPRCSLLDIRKKIIAAYSDSADMHKVELSLVFRGGNWSVRGLGTDFGALRVELPDC